MSTLPNRDLPEPLPFQPNSTGTKLHHPTLSSTEVLTAVNLAGAAYSNTLAGLTPYDLGDWEPITADLTDPIYGLDASFIQGGLFYQSSSFPTSLVNLIFPGTAEAIVFRNTTTNEVALAFRGTAGGVPFIAGDSGDWDPGRQLLHFAAFSDLFDALDFYLADQGITDVQVVGHSLGGAMTEVYMSTRPNGSVPGVTYSAVAVASPRASDDADARVLNIGHESDLVYSVAGIRNSNAVENTFVVFDENGWVDLFGDFTDVENQHSIQVSYRHSTKILLQSQFYGATDRDTRVIVALTNDEEELTEVATDFFFDSPSLILGRNETITLEDGTSLDENDFLIGGDGDDILEGFAGNDTLRGDVPDLLGSGKDTLSGGDGADLFLGTPGELNGDTITDLEIGDRIGVSGEGLLQADVTFNDTQIMINSDDGLFDFTGTEIAINAAVPEGASLRVLEETLPDGGAIIEVVPSVRQDIALLIDISGSMGDDIASVKSRSEDIVNAVFDGGTDARISIITFNTIGEIFTVLNFTDQENLEERKAAALEGIGRVNVSDGGIEPAYGAILSSLNGDAGAFRTEEGVNRQIVIFTDEPPGDPELRGEALAKARDLNVSVGANAVSTGDAMASSIALESTRFSLLETEETDPLPTQIFTVFIGGSTSDRAAYDELAEETSGAVFSAQNASEVVDKLLEVINLPVYSISANVSSIEEGDSGTQDVTFTVSRDVFDNAAMVTLSQSGTADAADVSGVPVSIAFEVGEASKSFVVAINGDEEIEPDETISLLLSSVTEPATLGGTAAVVTLLDDDEDALVSEIVGTDGKDELIGTDGDDMIFGLKRADRLEGGEGEDVIDGGKARDLIFGGLADDILFGGQGRDQIFGDEGDDMIFGGVSGDFIFGGDNNDIMLGEDGADDIDGGEGEDEIDGGRGSDKINGGFSDIANDILTGGRGSDTFEFAGLFGDDTITDFSEEDDILSISGQVTISSAFNGVDTIIIVSGAETVGTITLQGVEAEDLFGSAAA